MPSWLTCRKWRLLSREAFASDLAATKLCADMDVLHDQLVDDLVQLYHDVLTRLLDQHCPFITVRRRRKKTTPWFDADCHDARRRARAAERRFRRRRRDEDRREWSLKLQHMRSLYEVKCNGYWRVAISTSKGNSSELWKMLQGVLGEANGAVSDDFATFFQNKVDSIRSSTATTSLYDVPYLATPTISDG